MYRNIKRMNGTKSLSTILNQVVFRLTIGQKLDTQTALLFEEFNEIVSDQETILIGFFENESAVTQTLSQVTALNLPLKSYERI